MGAGAAARARRPGAIETERAHGDYWVPARAAERGGRRGRADRRRHRLAGAALSALRRRRGLGRHHRRPAPRCAGCCPRRETFNVVAEMGPPDARRTVVLVAHHDAAKSGLIFHPGIPAFVWRHFPSLIEDNDTSPPLMWPVFAGPALAALGALTGSRACAGAGGIVSAGAAAVFAQIGSTPHRAGRERQRHRGRRADRAGAAARRASRPPRCACCSCRPGRRSRSWRACRPSCAATLPPCRARTPSSWRSTRSARRT